MQGFIVETSFGLDQDICGTDQRKWTCQISAARLSLWDKHEEIKK